MGVGDDSWPNLFFTVSTLPLFFREVFSHTPQNGIRTAPSFQLGYNWWRTCALFSKGKIISRLRSRYVCHCLNLPALSDPRERVELISSLSVHCSSRYMQDLTSRSSKEIWYDLIPEFYRDTDVELFFKGWLHPRRVHFGLCFRASSFSGSLKAKRKVHCADM